MATIKPVYTKIPGAGTVDYTLGGKVPIKAEVSSDIGSRFTNRKASAVFTIRSLSTLEEGDAVGFKAADGTSYVLTAHDTTTSSSDISTPTYKIATTKKATAANMASAIAALTKFNATSDGAVVTVTQATAGEAGNTKVTSANKTCVNTKSFKGGGYAYDEHDEATAALAAGYAKNTADAKLLEHARKRNLGLI